MGFQWGEACRVWLQANRLVWCVHLGSVVFMTGLIWLVQLVQYPLMAEVGLASFREYHGGHASRITWIVLPVMMAEVLSVALLLWSAPFGQRPFWLALACAGLTGTVFLATAFLSVPAHNALSLGFDPTVHQRLVSTNWVRTVAWTVHAGLLLSATLAGLGREGP